MKFDIKAIIILILLLTSTIFGFMWFFNGNDASNEKVKQLEMNYEKLEKEKKALDSKILSLQVKFTELDKKDKQLDLIVEKSKIETKLAEIKANKSKEDLNKLKINIDKNNKEIEKLKKSQPSLTDDELLKSLIEKTK